MRQAIRKKFYKDTETNARASCDAPWSPPKATVKRDVYNVGRSVERLYEKIDQISPFLCFYFGARKNAQIQQVTQRSADLTSMEISLSHRSKKAQPTLPMRSTTPPFSPRWNDLPTSPMHDHLENTGLEERLCLSSPDVYDKRSLRPSMAFKIGRALCR